VKVLQVVPTLLPERGGPARTIPELCRALTALGVEVTLMATHESGRALTIDPQAEPYEVHLCSGAERSVRSARSVNRKISSRANEFDLVHIHSVWNLISTAAASAALSSGIPYVLAPMGMLSQACLRQSNFVAKRAYAVLRERRTVERAARLHLGSQQELNTLIDGWFQYPKHFIARNGASTPSQLHAGAFRGKFPELRNRKIMLFFGRLHAIKGLDLQLQAFAMLRAKHPDLFWVLVGPDGGEWSRLSNSIRTLGLNDCVRWTGPLNGEDRFEALLDCDVLVHTSHYENQTMTINEALAVGAPLVITDSVNYPEVEARGAGFVGARNAEALAASIDRLLREPAAANKMRESGRSFASSDLAWSGVAETVLHAYDEIIGERENAGRRATPRAAAAGGAH
jgi:glycosyltransferase involved in cell wall biosynthesis